MYLLNFYKVALLVFSFANKLNIFYFNEFMVGCEPKRVCGPVRYPNTFAAIIAAYSFYIFTIMILKKSFDWVNGFLMISTVAYEAVLLNTYSRGAYIFFVGTFILAIILPNKGKRGDKHGRTMFNRNL